MRISNQNQFLPLTENSNGRFQFWCLLILMVVCLNWAKERLLYTLQVQWITVGTRGEEIQDGKTFMVGPWYRYRWLRSGIFKHVLTPNPGTRFVPVSADMALDSYRSRQTWTTSPGLGFGTVQGVFWVPDSVLDSFRHGQDPGFSFEPLKVGIADLCNIA